MPQWHRFAKRSATRVKYRDASTTCALSCPRLVTFTASLRQCTHPPWASCTISNMWTGRCGRGGSIGRRTTTVRDYEGGGCRRTRQASRSSTSRRYDRLWAWACQPSGDTGKKEVFWNVVMILISIAAIAPVLGPLLDPTRWGRTPQGEGAMLLFVSECIQS